MNKRIRVWLAVLLCICVMPLLMGVGDTRRNSYGSFTLMLDGVNVGFIKSISGGGISAEVINEAVGPDYFVKKHIGQPKYEDFELSIGFGMTKPVYEWIESSWNQNYVRKDGSIIAADFNYNAKSEREFFQALITETTIPAMDGASKDPAYIKVKFSPEYTRYKKATGKVSPDPTVPAPGSAKQKTWLPSNFRLEIPGLDTKGVLKVDAFTVKQTAVQDDIGDARDYAKEPGKVEFPALKFTLTEETAMAWMDWFEDFVINGNNTEDQEKSGALVFLDPTRKNELGRIRLYNLGIYRLAPEKSEANDDKIKRWVAELYCERMELSIGSPVGN